MGKLYVSTAVYSRVLDQSDRVYPGPFTAAHRRKAEREGSLFVTEDPSLPDHIAEWRSKGKVTRFDFSPSQTPVDPRELFLEGEGINGASG